MAVPGFSVSDLIQALGHAKTVYDAFFNEYTNSASQLRDLGEDIMQFQRNLQDHQEILEAHGRQYSGVEGAYRTVDACNRFLHKYRAVIDDRRRKSVVGTFKTAKYVYEADEVKNLREQIARHQNNIMHFSLNIVLKNTLSHPEPVTPTTVSPTILPVQTHDAISPPSTPPLSLPSPIIQQSGFSPRSSRLSNSSSSAERPLPPVFEDSRSTIVASPQLIPANRSPVLQSTSTRSSPAQYSAGRNSQGTLNIPWPALPQPALPYIVAEVYFAKKKVELKRKATGNDTENGREMVIVDENGNLRYQHRLKAPRTQACFPYTWHRKWQKKGFVIDFLDAPPGAHSISFKGETAISAVPKYVFTQQKDSEDFQSELRGKRLEGTFEIRKISSAAVSNRYGEATDQHLKIWQDYSSKECTVSFYASAVSEPGHKEFPLVVFDQELGFDKKMKEEMTLNFVLANEKKHSRAYSKDLSRSPTEATTATNTTVPTIFSSNTEVASSASSMTTVSTSRTASGLYQFDGAGQSERSKSEKSLRSLAKDMKYIRIEFSDETESTRFKQTFDRLYQEEMSRPQDFFQEWRMRIERERAESIVSSSPTGTPFAMSPELRPTRSRTGSSRVN